MTTEMAIFISSITGSFIGTCITLVMQRRVHRKEVKHIIRVMNDNYNHTLRQLVAQIDQKDRELKELKEKLKNTLI